MNTSKIQIIQLQQPNRSVFLFNKYGRHQGSPKTLNSTIEAREIGREMAQKVSKKLKLNLDV